MKKVISILVVFSLLITAAPALAQESIPQADFIHEIILFAEKRGGTVNVYDENIVVTKGDKNCLITPCNATYMDNGVLVTESLTADGEYINLPTKALLSVFENTEPIIIAKPEKTKAYDKAMANFYGERRIVNKIETDYGTIVKWDHIGIYSLTDGDDYENYLEYVKYDGTTLDLASYIPNADDINKMPYEKMEIDGNVAIITYPEIRNAGTFVVTVDLENCTAKREIIPYVEKAEPIEEITEDDDIIASGLCEGYFWWGDSRPEATVTWEYSCGTLIISGTGDMHDFYYSYGGRKIYTTTIGKPWKEYYDKIKKVVIKEGVNSVSRFAFEDCKNIKEVVVADNVSIGNGAFKNLTNLEKVTLGKNCTLERNAFITCTALQEITLPEGTVVGEDAFSHCYSLKDVTSEGENISIDKTAFSDCPFVKHKTKAYDEWFQMREMMGAYIQNKTETDYGTIVEWSRISYSKVSGSKVHTYISYVTYDGESIGITAPSFNETQVRKYKTLEISADGKYATLTYPQTENEGSVIIIVDLVNCTAERYMLQKTKEYEEKMASFIGGAQRIANKTETDYGTIVERAHMGYIAPYGTTEIENLVVYVRWDGESVSISQYAPDENDIEPMAYESLVISEDGKTAIVTYPELKNTGTFVVTVDLVNCTAEKSVIPYVKKEEPADDFEDTETASGKCQGYDWMQDRPDTDVLWEYENGTLTISGTGLMHDFSYTWGGRTQHTTKMSSPWGRFDKIKKIVIEEGVESVSRWAFDECVNVEEVIIADNVRINAGAFHYLRNLEKVTLGKNCYIGEQAFRGCSAIEKITIPEGTTVYYGAFADCYALKEVNMEGENISVVDSSFLNTPFVSGSELNNN